MAATETLTAERILEATEEVLRRYGPAKATVVDVARVLGVSHGSVYRHFRTKAALREAVTERWLERTIVALEPYVEAPGSADERLTGWLTALFALKRRKAGGDPELMATFQVLIGENSAVVHRHEDHLVEQIARIVEDGHREGCSPRRSGTTRRRPGRSSTPPTASTTRRTPPTGRRRTSRTRSRRSSP